jgi:SAM-dependent methyltransferase
MAEAQKLQTADANGRLWGARARDWAELQEGTLRAAFEAVLEKTGVGKDTRYLDVGCGSGMAARMAADLGAEVSGIDAAEALLAIARERTPGGDFRQADLEALPFADAAFDVVTGFNAFQYAGDPTRALAEAWRVTRKGGVVAMLVWGAPEGMAMASVVKALGPLLPPPPPGAGGPFALSNEAALTALAETAGLRPQAVFDVATRFDYPDLETALRGLNASGVAARAMQAAGEAAVTHAHTQALTPFRRPDGAYAVGASFLCLLAGA